VVAEARVAAPQHSYEATLNALATMIGALEQQAGLCSVGIGMPGSLSPRTGLVQNANSIWLNGRALQADLEGLTSRPIRFANDANCFALSEAHDGSALGAHTVFGVILGTGCGGGIVIDGKLVDGPRGIGGEWGHTPLPWPTRAELDVAPCWCGRSGCLETWISGSALAADHRRVSGVALAGEAIVAEAGNGSPPAQATLDRHAGRLARGLAAIVNILDPDVIVLGGGLSALPHLYQQLPGLMTPYIFADQPMVDIRPPRWGDASGVRGAARLWP
jgi:fructokinase